MSSEETKPDTSENSEQNQKGHKAKIKDSIHQKMGDIDRRYPQPTPKPVYNNRVVFGAGLVTGLITGIWIGIFIYLFLSRFIGA